MYNRDCSQSSTPDDHWSEARNCREDWRTGRDARCAALRAHLHGNGGWGNWDDWGLNQGMGSGTMGAGMMRSSPQDNAVIEAMKAKIAGMTSTIDTLAARVNVLERLALERMAQDDEAPLAAEIEKLRDADDTGAMPEGDRR
jgi:hypothetical protein